MEKEDPCILSRQIWLSICVTALWMKIIVQSFEVKKEHNRNFA